MDRDFLNEMTGACFSTMGSEVSRNSRKDTHSTTDSQPVQQSVLFESKLLLRCDLSIAYAVGKMTEITTQGILKSLLKAHLDDAPILQPFNTALKASLIDSANDINVVGFKSIACYRTGLDVAPEAASEESLLASLAEVSKTYRETATIRLAHKALNDHIVRMALEVSGECGKPGSVGLFRAQIMYSSLSSPIPHRSWGQRYHAKPLIAVFPSTGNQGIPQYTVCSATLFLSIHPRGGISCRCLFKRVPRLRRSNSFFLESKNASILVGLPLRLRIRAERNNSTSSGTLPYE